jgi:hypothetical protein
LSARFGLSPSLVGTLRLRLAFSGQVLGYRGVWLVLGWLLGLQRIAMELDWWEKAFSGQPSALSEEKIAES